MPAGTSQAVLSAEDYRMLLGLDFMTFAQRVFHDLRPESAFEPHPYLEVLASRLEECRQGTTGATRRSRFRVCRGIVTFAASFGRRSYVALPLPRPSVPASRHPARRLALPALHAEPA